MKPQNGVARATQAKNQEPIHRASKKEKTRTEQAQLTESRKNPRLDSLCFSNKNFQIRVCALDFWVRGQDELSAGWCECTNVTSESGQGNVGGGSGCCRRRNTGKCMCLLHRSHHSLRRLLSGNGRSEKVGIRGEVVGG